MVVSKGYVSIAAAGDVVVILVYLLQLQLLQASALCP
jgi:hypothetical protein